IIIFTTIYFLLMKTRLRLKLIFAFFIYLFANLIFAQEIGKSWEFNEAGNFEGIIFSKALKDSVVENGYLTATVANVFPSISSEPFELNANEYGFVQIRLRLPGATSGKIMWNNDSGAWGYTTFITDGDSTFQEFDIPVYQSNQWVGKITKIMRLDFNPTIGSKIDIDYIRIVHFGVRPIIKNFSAIRTILKPNQNIPLTAIIKNDGDEEANFKSKLILPEGANLLSGNTDNEHGIIFNENYDTINWIISFTNFGNYDIIQKLFNENDTTEKKLICNVSENYWKQNEFLLSAWSPPYAWYGPPYENIIFEDYANANFKNVLWVRPEVELIEKVKEYNLKYFLLVTNILGGDVYLRAPEEQIPPEITEEMLLSLDAVIDKYKDDPNLIGYHICDEPYEEAFENIAKVVQRIREKDPSRLSFVNIWPSGSGYREYIDNLLQTTKLELLSYDRYHFFNGYDGGEYFSNLDVIREYALKYDIPFCNIIQAIGTNGTVEQGLNWRTPNENGHRWLVYSSLAYGVHGLIWFHWHGDWGLTGNPDRNIIYPSIQKINAEIDSLSQIMVQLKTTGVYHSKISEPKWKLPSNGIIKSVSDNADLVIGYFTDHNEKNYFMLMNKDYDKSTLASISMNGIGENLIYFDVITNQWISVNEVNNSGVINFDIELDAGSGKLFSFSKLTEVSENNFTPIKFELEQNYPNLFNPTTIKYSIPVVTTRELSQQTVKLIVYNILGKEVVTLVNQKQSPGNYEIKFNGFNLSSGIYFYKLKYGSYAQAKKMIVLK
ncbi:MAG: T9SS type A sorting domain-containing protein, partial [Melioribacteraceae bacterium]